MMESNLLFQYLDVDVYSATPKYLQVANSIIEAIKTGLLKQDEILPSINELNNHLDISRDTAEKSYRHLRKLKAIISVPGKGFFVARTNFNEQLKICLLFNKLSTHKKLIYDAFIKEIGRETAVDFYIYDNDFSLFKALLNSKIEAYDYFVIIPHFLDGELEASELINKIPKHKLVLLDKLLPGVTADYAAVYENFASDIFGALEQAIAKLKKYQNIKIVFPKASYFPKEILTGFYRFCQQYGFTHKVIHQIKDEEIAKGDVFINLMEDDLVMLIERLIALKLKIGKDVGVISYNETPLKRIILDGLTTISTDFKLLGATAARLILDKKTEQIAIPFYLILRNSL